MMWSVWLPVHFGGAIVQFQTYNECWLKCNVECTIIEKAYKRGSSRFGLDNFLSFTFFNFFKILFIFLLLSAIFSMSQIIIIKKNIWNFRWIFNEFYLSFIQHSIVWYYWNWNLRAITIFHHTNSELLVNQQFFCYYYLYIVSGF